MSDLLTGATSSRAIQELRQDWRYKAGIEDGRRDGQRGVEVMTRLRESERDLALIELYRIDPVACAKLCDDRIDQSGALLGRVREWAANA